MTSSCRTCSHYDIEAHRNAGGRIVVRNDKAARCLFDMQRIVRKMPASLGERDRVLVARWMTADEGQRCPQYTVRKGDDA